MKNLRNFVVVTLLLSPALTCAAELQRIPAATSITAVTVYADRALTSRSASLNLKPGSYLITFQGLPTLIQDDSVRGDLGDGGDLGDALRIFTFEEK